MGDSWRTDLSSFSEGKHMTTLFVGNLSWGTTEESLSAFLGQFGTVTSCDTGTVRNGRTRGWAIVTMQNEAEADYCISAANGKELDGRPLNIRLDQKPEKGASLLVVVATRVVAVVVPVEATLPSRARLSA